MRAIGGGWRGCSKLPAPAGSQKCMVKPIIRGGGVGSSLAYFERDGRYQEHVQGYELHLPNDHAQLFDKDGTIPRDYLEQFRTVAKEDSHHFHLIVSPEYAPENMREFTQRFMQRMESDIGTRLGWMAVTHYNSSHDHAHIGIRGIDAHGDRLYLSRAYLREGLKTNARDLLTQEHGPARLDMVRDYTREYERGLSIEHILEQERTRERTQTIERVYERERGQDRWAQERVRGQDRGYEIGF